MGKRQGQPGIFYTANLPREKAGTMGVCHTVPFSNSSAQIHHPQFSVKDYHRYDPKASLFQASTIWYCRIESLYGVIKILTNLDSVNIGPRSSIEYAMLTKVSLATSLSRPDDEPLRQNVAPPLAEAKITESTCRAWLARLIVYAARNGGPLLLSCVAVLKATFRAYS